jgi:hypothetical protein
MSSTSDVPVVGAVKATATSKLVSSFALTRAREVCSELLAAAGVTVDGPEPWDVKIHDERIWARVLRDGTPGKRTSKVGGIVARSTRQSVVCKRSRWSMRCVTTGGWCRTC